MIRQHRWDELKRKGEETDGCFDQLPAVFPVIDRRRSETPWFVGYFDWR
jgi:hypothetical protein